MSLQFDGGSFAAPDVPHDDGVVRAAGEQHPLNWIPTERRHVTWSPQVWTEKHSSTERRIHKHAPTIRTSERTWPPTIINNFNRKKKKLQGLSWIIPEKPPWTHFKIKTAYHLNFKPIENCIFCFFLTPQIVNPIPKRQRLHFKSFLEVITQELAGLKSHGMDSLNTYSCRFFRKKQVNVFICFKYSAERQKWVRACRRSCTLTF